MITVSDTGRWTSNYWQHIELLSCARHWCNASLTPTAVSWPLDVSNALPTLTYIESSQKVNIANPFTPVLRGEPDARNGEATCPMWHRPRGLPLMSPLRSERRRWHRKSWLSQRGGSATYLIPRSPGALLSSEADDLAPVVTARSLQWNASPRSSWVGVWELQGCERLLISLQACQHWSPPAGSRTSWSWKIKTHKTTLSSAPRKQSWVAGKSRFIDIFWAPEPAGGVRPVEGIGSPQRGWAPWHGSHIGTKQGPFFWGGRIQAVCGTWVAWPWMTARSWPELRSRVGCLTHQATQVPHKKKLVNSTFQTSI